MTNNNGFTYRYAIRRPDGELIRQPKSDTWLIGLFGPPPPVVEVEEVPPPKTWDTREAADKALAALRKQAAALGVSDWLGVVVQQLCTPFTTHGPEENFASEVQQWLEGGAE